MKIKSLKFLLFALAALAVMSLGACNDGSETKSDDGDVYDEAYWAENAAIDSGDALFTATENGGTIAFPTKGGSVAVSVDCGTEWTALSGADWLSAKISGSTLTVAVDQNTVESDLSGTVTLETALSGIRFATITVTQNAYGAPEISVDAVNWNAPAVGALSMTVAVTASGDFSAVNNAEWLTVDLTEGGITLTAEANDAVQERSDVVTLTCGDGIRTATQTIAVTQDGVAYLTLGAESLEFNSDAASATVSVESNFDWTAACTESWITISQDGGTLTVTVAENASTEQDRSGVVTVTASDGAENVAEALITVTQESIDEALILEYTLPGSYTTVYLPLAGTVDCIVDWGDGSDPETVTSVNPSHRYTVTNTTVRVRAEGTVTALSSKKSTTSGYSTYLTSVVQWGSTGLTDLSNAFYMAYNLASLPETTGDALAEVTSFKYCFYNPSITSIPADFLAASTKATDLSYVFYMCGNVTSIPKGLFDSCIGATTFDHVFYGCSGLTAVPDGLFDKCPETTSFGYAFYGCSALRTVPTDIFDANTKVTSFSSTFYGCSALTGESPYTSVGDAKVHLYERADHTDTFAEPTKYGSCFTGCTGLTDYSSIPSAWGGGAE